MAQKDDKSVVSRAHTGGLAPERRVLLVAAVLLDEDAWTDERIAAALGISRRTLARWKTRPEVAFALDMAGLARARDLARRYYPRAWNAKRLGPGP